MMIIFGILIPFIGTSLGAAMVFFMKNVICDLVEKVLLGVAAGVMIAASVWSLLLPSIDMATTQGVVAWVPAVVGFVIGVFGLLLIHYFLSLSIFKDDCYFDDKFKKVFMMILAVTLHNIPEGMAVGVVFASALSNNNLVSMAGAFSLAIGIAIQNFPEGAIISMPLKSKGVSKVKSFWYGMLSGVVEPIAAIITIFLVSYINIILPYLLSFAAGAMIYVVVDELIPESQNGKYKHFGLIGLCFGFLIMMVLDVAFG